MIDTILCPHCNKTIPLTDVLSHQLTAQNNAEIERLISQKKEEIEKNANIEREKLIEQTKKNVQTTLLTQMKDKENEITELKQANKSFQNQLLELNKTLRQMRTDNESMRLEYQKKFLESEEKITEKANKKAQDEMHLKLLEKDKQLQDAMKVADDYKRKLEQRSQQLQGEVLELEIEQKLHSTFPYDEIIPISKGVRGGDIVQIVRSKQGVVCGKILWETKRTERWSNDWIKKLKEDRQRVKADIAVLISNVLPQSITRFGELEGVWVSEYESIIGVASALRSGLIELIGVKNSQVNREGKLELLHEYISGVEFKHKIETIVEAFSVMQEEMEREKRWFSTKWARQERAIRKVIDQTHAMHGELQGIMGKALPDIEDKKMLIEENTGQLF